MFLTCNCVLRFPMKKPVPTGKNKEGEKRETKKKGEERPSVWGVSPFSSIAAIDPRRSSQVYVWLLALQHSAPRCEAGHAASTVNQLLPQATHAGRTPVESRCFGHPGHPKTENQEVLVRFWIVLDRPSQ